MPNQSSKPAVLVVDDDPALLQLIVLSLKNDFVVKVATSGADGLVEFHQTPFDVVVVDRSMPGMTGDVFAAKIKEHAPQIPIILISGYLDKAVDMTLFNAFLPKPFRKVQLIDALNSVLVTAS